MPGERSLDFMRGEAVVFIHCSLSRALGVPSGIHALVGREIKISYAWDPDL